MRITPDRSQRAKADHLAGLLLVLALHAAALYGLWQHQPVPAPQTAVTLFVSVFATPETPKASPARPAPPEPLLVGKPQPRQLLAKAPATAPPQYRAPPAPAPEPAIPATPTPLPATPVTLSAELSATCPERPAPGYPAPSRSLGETGMVVLSVELSETGQVIAAHINKSSRHPRLDEAALAAVRTWRCNPAMRNGQPVRAFALQPFNFVLEGN